VAREPRELTILANALNTEKLLLEIRNLCSGLGPQLRAKKGSRMEEALELIRNLDHW
jgi:hypothetical protein